MHRFLLVLIIILCSPALADPVADLKGCIVNLNTLGDALEAHFARTGSYPASLTELGMSLPSCPAAGSDTYSAGYIGPSDPAAPDYLLSCKGAHHPGQGEDTPSYVAGEITCDFRALYTGSDRLCLENMSNLMVALELYSTEHEGAYPAQLSELTTPVPACPVANRDTYSDVYALSQGPDAYTLLCEEGSHQALGISSGRGVLKEPSPAELASVEAVLADCRRRNQAPEAENGYLDLVEVIGTKDLFVEEKAAPYLALGKNFESPPKAEDLSAFAALLPGLRAALSKPALAYPIGAEPGWEDPVPNLVAIRNLNRSLIVYGRNTHDSELIMLGLEMSARLSGRRPVVLDMVAATLAGDSIKALLGELAARPAPDSARMLARVGKLFPPENLLLAADFEWAFWDRAYFRAARDGKLPESLKELFEGMKVSDWEAERELLGQQYRAFRPVLARCGAPARLPELTRPAHVFAATSWPIVVRNWARLQHRLAFLKTVLALDAYHQAHGRYPANLGGLPRPVRPPSLEFTYARNGSAGYLLESERVGNFTRSGSGGSFEEQSAPVQSH
ncbi:MAG: hypothetical protein AMXMBFR33_41420 [Candidatus Xenobia bacterium]